MFNPDVPLDDSPLSRRDVLRRVGAFGLGAIATSAVGTGAAWAATKTTKRATRTTAKKIASKASCVLSPQQSEGPYYLDLDQVRSNITEGRAGASLEVALTVMDVKACQPLAGAAVDIWHCDALGAYSGVSGDRAVFLRGTQLCDSAGNVRFTTIYPGSYPGRTAHIHVKVRVAGNDTYTGQLYFDDAVTDLVYKSAPYASAGQRDGRNANDGIYRQNGASSTLALAKKGTGYLGAMTLGVRS